mgnify:CR=1 FL=1
MGLFKMDRTLDQLITGITLIGVFILKKLANITAFATFIVEYIYLIKHILYILIS